MHVLSFTRSTPDTSAKVWVDAAGDVTWGKAGTVVNPWDEYALEETIAQAQNTSGRATVIAIGPAMHDDALKHSIAMGAAQALRVYEPGADSHDSLVWSALAAGAIEKLGDVELIICGKESIDVATDQHTYQLARRLGWTMLSYVSRIIAINPEAATLRVEQTLEQGKRVLSARLPAVITVLKGINEPRYPNFLGIRKAAKAEIPVWSAADLGTQPPKAATAILSYRNPAARDVATEIITGPDSATKAAILAQRLIEEKVL